MNHSLIIDARKQLTWHQRLFSDTSTAMMWAVWLLLWRPIVLFTWVMSIHQPAVLWHFLDMIGLEQYITALLACGAALLLWNTLPSHQVRDTNARELNDYATHFKLDSQQIVAGREQRICTIHHDENGKIIGIE